MDEYGMMKINEGYENEAWVMEREMGLPESYMRLGEVEQRMLMLYMEDVREPMTGESTYGKVFTSWLYANRTEGGIRIPTDLFIKEIDTVIDSKTGELVEVEKTVPNPDKMNLYLRLKARAFATWRQNNMHELVKPMREIFKNAGLKDEQLLEQAIVDDALSADKSNYTARMRSLAVKVKGMEKNNTLQMVNVYVEGGGDKLNRTIIEETGNDTYDLGLED